MPVRGEPMQRVVTVNSSWIGHLGSNTDGILEIGAGGSYLHCATLLTAVRSLRELFEGRFLAASSAAAQAAAGSPFWNLAQARLVQASLKSGASLTASSSTTCASRGRLATRSRRP